MNIHPDLMLILVKNHPIGTMKGKQPGKVAMSRKFILGEVFDQLLHLALCSALTILTSFEDWRICWLDSDTSHAIASMSTLPTQTRYKLPRRTIRGFFQLENRRRSPEPPCPSRECNAILLHNVDDTAGDIDGDTKRMTWTGIFVQLNELEGQDACPCTRFSCQENDVIPSRGWSTPSHQLCVERVYFRMEEST